MSWSGYEDDVDLESLIQGAINGFSSDRRAYWAERPGGPTMVKWADDVADKLVSAADELTQPARIDWPDLDWSDVERMAQVEGLRELVLERVQVQVAWQLCTDSDGKGSRCLELTEDLLAEQLSENVLRFVRRVSRCYIAGFGPECVILCRGVLENGIKERFRRAGVRTPRAMRKKLEVAEGHGWLTSDARSDAWIVWKRGSKMIHDDVEVVKDVRGTVRMTVRVLNELFR